ncbi:17456_t:CDS:1, partial [Entrophospora sp. SA101]
EAIAIENKTIKEHLYKSNITINQVLRLQIPRSHSLTSVQIK